MKANVLVCKITGKVVKEIESSWIDEESGELLLRVRWEGSSNYVTIRDSDTEVVEKLIHNSDTQSIE